MSSFELISLPKILDPRGNLSFLEEGKHIPFLINRTHWIYDVPGGEVRGGHSYKQNKEFIIALSGSFDVIINEGSSPTTVTLNRSYVGLLINNGIWRHMENFSTNALALVVSSHEFDENDYIRDFSKYKNEKQ